MEYINGVNNPDSRVNPEVNDSNDIGVRLSDDEKKAFSRLIKIGIFREMHRENLIDDGQLHALLGKFYGI